MVEQPRISRWAVKDAVLSPACSLSPTQRLVMLALVLRADAETGRIPRWKNPTIEELHGETALATSTVRDALSKLSRLGWITRERRSRRAAVEYQLTSPPTTGALSPPTTGALHPSPPTTGALSAPTTVPSPPTTGAESADHRRTLVSSLSDSSSPLPAAVRDDPRPEFDDAFLDRLGSKIGQGCTRAEASRIAAAALAETARTVHSPPAWLLGHKTSNLRQHLQVVRARERGRLEREARDRCSTCDENRHVLGSDGLPVDPVRLCEHPGAGRRTGSGDLIEATA